MSLNGLFALYSVSAQVRLEFLRECFESNCVKNSKGRPILSAAEMFSVDSSFWRYKIYGDIRGNYQIFMKIFVRPMFACVQICCSSDSANYRTKIVIL